MNTVKNMLDNLGLHEKWLTENIVDQAFVEKWHAKLTETDAEHIRVQFYASFFTNHQKTELSDSHIKTYLELVQFEEDRALKRWAIGCLVECETMSISQLKYLRQNRMLEKKHHVFLEREINRKIL